MRNTSKTRAIRGIAGIAVIAVMLLAGCPDGAKGGNDANGGNGYNSGDNQTPVADDYDIGSLTQTFGSVTAVSVKPKPDKSAGRVAVYYEGIAGTKYIKRTALPTEIGSYAVTFNVAPAAGWNAAKDLSAGTLTIRLVDMVSIPGGAFMMGSPASEPNRISNETLHRVTLSAFSMSKYQVTQEQYQAVMGIGADTTEARYGKGEKYPIYYISWYNAIVFCNKLSMMEGLNPVYRIGSNTNPAQWGAIPTANNDTWNGAVMDRTKNGYRLPTEAEWEYACRGSYRNKATEQNTKPFGIGDGSKMVSGMANFNVTSPYDSTRDPPGEYTDESATGNTDRTKEVGSFTANNYGLYDMHGNVWEWCWDRYKEDITMDNNNPIGEGANSINRVIRGGNWETAGRHLRSAYRTNRNPNGRAFDIGIRLVRS